MLTLNLLLSMIINAKVKGRGLVSNGKIYTKFMSVISDDSEQDLLKKFNNELVMKESYRKLDRFLSRFLKDGKGYPYDLMNFREFEKNIGDKIRYDEYLRKTEKICSEILDEEKIDCLVYKLLEIIRQDDRINLILYDSEFIGKEKIFGEYAHPKRICIEAFLLGLFYHVHKNPARSVNIELSEIPERRTFQAVHFSHYNSLALEIPLNLIENINENASRQKSAELKYPLKFRLNNEIISELPQNKNIFLYGIGGTGKTTVLLNQLKNSNSTGFYFTLYRYKPEIRQNFRPESCRILLLILLRFHYQYEYLTYESCCSKEGEENILRQLMELENIFKISPVNSPKYTLLLDGFNEISADFQSDFICELEYICNCWHNVRVIIAGRNIPDYDIFKNFDSVELCGFDKNELRKILSDDTPLDDELAEILKLPVFLDMYSETHNKFTNRGELIDGYVMKRSEVSDNTEKFLIRYVLPFIAKKTFRIMLRHNISRAEAIEAVDSAISYYLMNDNIFQNYISPENFSKNALRESRAKKDWIRILINTGFLETDTSSPRFLHFTNQYYQEYFAAKHIINLIESALTVYDPLSGRLPENIMEYGLFSQWYGNFGCAESDGIYRFIGEMCSENSLLEGLLEISRSFHGYFTAENVIRTAKISYENKIFGADFSELKLPAFMCGDVEFIDCDFRKSIVPFQKKLHNVSFENCDFSGAVFWFEEDKKLFAELGASMLN